MVTVGDKVPMELFEPLLKLLSKTKVSKTTVTSNRRDFPLRHRAVCYGMIKSRYSNSIGLSNWSKKKPDIYEEIMKLGKIICPFPFSSIHLNNNVVCPKHKDNHNVDNSLLISFGDYTGCNIVIGDVIYDAKYTPLIFNGAAIEHYNTDDLEGNKYSLIYYNIL